MSRFAKISERAIARQSELSGEEWRLYCLLKFHTWNDSGVCNKNLRELATAYRLDYDNTTRRYKILREKGWCQNTPKGILLLDLETVNFTVKPPDETVKFTVEGDSKTVKNAVSDCKFYSSSDSKTVKNAVSFNKEYKEPFKNENFLTAAAAETEAAAAVETNGHKSLFSIEECLRYAAVCVKRGDPIKSVEGLARHAHQTGEMDAFIQAVLYPAKPDAAQEINFAGLKIDGGDLTGKERVEALKLLADVNTMGDDLNEFEHYYTPPDWVYLMSELNKIHK